MNLYVLFGQRMCINYPGEYALEALSCASEADMDGNPDYIPEQKAKYEATKEFERLAVVTLNVKESDIRAIMFPENNAVPATVIAD
ncbi:hypothetical protein [Pseudomonas serbica]|uniref:hypothetical protein n=1 Tax=Pseudomonas serbica TaxID=2965074 RepID=UPI00237B618D|nr:hypothetical protein [Pseudomonas serbica]